MVVVAVEGCCHGDLDEIYATVERASEELKKRDATSQGVEILLCCGDFQAVRDESDLACLSVPPKYRSMKGFHRYFNGEKTAPVLTLFVGGNHEASNHLQELFHGGWVAHNIYYLGAAGVVRFRGLRIAGLSGIYKPHDYKRGRFEKPPFDGDSLRSVYHTRIYDTFRLQQLAAKHDKSLQTESIQPRQRIDIMLSHDWPCGIWQYGNHARLTRSKPFLQQDMDSGRLGSPPSWELLKSLRPRYWFSAHLHCKFAAVVPHGDSGEETRFLALDKCLPKRDFLQILTIDPPLHNPTTDEKTDTASGTDLEYDLEWLSIERSFYSLQSSTRGEHILPENGTSCTGPSPDDDAYIYDRFKCHGNNIYIQNVPSTRFHRGMAVEQTQHLTHSILGVSANTALHDNPDTAPPVAHDANEIDLDDE